MSLHETCWVISDIGGSQMMGVRVSFVRSGWSPISYGYPRPVAALPYRLVMEQEQVTLV